VAGVKLGQILALVGLVLMVLGSMGRRRGRRQPPGAAALGRWQRWGDYLGLALIAAGLLIMWAQK
jgi:hypothetical protein